MGYSPQDILSYVIEKSYEGDFLNVLQTNKNNYSIAEMMDKKFIVKPEYVKLISKQYSINLELNDAEVIGAIRADRYVSVFISRKDDNYNIHFYIHNCRIDEKKYNEELILQEVVQYMIFKTILELRLDTPLKIDTYLGK